MPMQPDKQQPRTAVEIAEEKADAMIRAAQKRREQESMQQQEVYKEETDIAKEKGGKEDEKQGEQEEKKEHPLLAYLNTEDQKELTFYYSELEKAEEYGVVRQEYANQIRKNIAQLEQRAQERKEIMDREQERAEISLTKSSLPGKHWEDYNKDIDCQRDKMERNIIKRHKKKGLWGWLGGLFK